MNRNFMQTRVSPTNPSVVETAEAPKRLPAVVLETTLEMAPAHPAAGECACARIRLASQVLRELLLKDELAFGKTLVIGVVSSRLDEIQGELEQLAGMQRLFETWVEG
jgi:hypothetical protein